jgi:hypothetical protein
MVEHLPSKCKALNSNPSTAGKKNKTKKNPGALALGGLKVVSRSQSPPTPLRMAVVRGRLGTREWRCHVSLALLFSQTDCKHLCSTRQVGSSSQVGVFLLTVLTGPVVMAAADLSCLKWP